MNSTLVLKPEESAEKQKNDIDLLRKKQLLRAAKGLKISWNSLKTIQNARNLDIKIIFVLQQSRNSWMDLAS